MADEKIMGPDDISWADFSFQTAEYQHDRRTSKLLNALWGQGKTVAEAIAYIRERGAITDQERKAAYQEKLDGWRNVREERTTLTLSQFRTRIRAVLMKELARLETKKMTPECSMAFEAMKRQILLE